MSYVQPLTIMFMANCADRNVRAIKDIVELQFWICRYFDNLRKFICMILDHFLAMFPQLKCKGRVFLTIIYMEWPKFMTEDLGRNNFKRGCKKEKEFTKSISKELIIFLPSVKDMFCCPPTCSFLYVGVTGCLKISTGCPRPFFV